MPKKAEKKKKRYQARVRKMLHEGHENTPQGTWVIRK